MIAKFDSYRKFETPMLYVCNPGCVYNGKLLSNVAGILTDVSDIELVFNFNATSELNFRAYKVRRQDAEENRQMLSLYRSLRNRKLIYMDDIGFFVITEVEESYDKGIYYKDIKAESCEAELRNKGIPYIPDGTYKFFTGESGNPGIIEMLMQVAPMWTLGDIDVSVVNRWRTFEDVDITKNILGFMLENLQDAYECLFEFDPINRIVSVYDQSNYVHETNIHITKDDLISGLEVTESSDDLYTAVSVTGDEDLSINAINPLGTNVIYNFNYYLDWMTSDLGEKVRTWQNLIDSYSQQYYNIQLAKHNNLTAKSVLESERVKLDTQLTMYSRCRDNIVAEASDEDIAEYNRVIIEVGGIPIPETTHYTWIKFADDEHGTNLTDDPYGKRYIGLAYDKGTQVASLVPTDYEWHTFRDGETFPRTIEGQTTYTWVTFADTTTSGMSDNPDDKTYIGITFDRESPTKSTDYRTYTWQLLNKGNLGIPQVLARIVSLVEMVTAELEDNAAAIAVIDEAIDEEESQIDVIHSVVSMTSYFNQAELEELSNYISEGNFTDEYVTVTESMTYAQRFQQMKTLYDRAKAQLDKISVPTQEFDVDVENFIFLKDFEEWSDQLETGCLINVELETDDVAALFLSSFEVNYEDKKLKMTFGNRYNRFDSKALFNDLLGSVSKTANTLSYIKDTIYPIKNGELNAMKEALDSSRTLTKNSVLSSQNEQVIIDDTGYTGRRKLPNGSIDPKQIKINGRNIVFTDDAWETCKTAIGEILLGDDASAYGINAEILLGNIIMGNELHIVNSEGEDMFTVTEDNIMFHVGQEYAKKEDAIVSVDVEYCRATSNTSPLDPSTITVDWSTSAPEWKNGEYIWQRTVTTYDDGSADISDATCISGTMGKDGRGIKSSEVKYQKTAVESTTPPTGEWQTSIPSMDQGEYLWTRCITTYTDDSTSTVYTVSKFGLSSNSAIAYLYKRSDTTPTVDWSNNLIYSFTDKAITSSAPSGWSKTIPSGTAPLYVTAATAYGSADTDTIAPNEWSTPVKYVENGLNTAVIRLYQRSAISPSRLSGSVTYTFATGAITGALGNWSTIIPNIDGNPCYMIQATASSASPTDTIAASEWSATVKIVEDGKGISSTVVKYAKSNSGTVFPTDESKWGTAVPETADGEFLWTRTQITYTDDTTSTSYSVSRNGLTGSGGGNSATIYLYKRSATQASIDWTNALTYSFADKALTSVPTGWSQSVPTTGTDPIYMTAATAFSSSSTDTIAANEWATPVMFSKNGADGDDGFNSATIMLYQRAATAPSKPTGSLTYTFSTGALSGSIGDWKRTVPVNDGNPCYMIQATAISNTATDTIANSEWSEVRILVVDGEDGVGISSSEVKYQVSTSGTTVPTGTWSDSIPVLDEGKYLWTRTIFIYEDGTRTDPSYSVSRNGTNGVDGGNSAVIYLYKRSASPVSIDWSTSLTYSFESKSLTSVPTGWSQTIPGGSDPLYATAATAYSNTATDTIAANEWSSPSMLSRNGTDGINAATVFLYQRSETAPTAPESTLTYTFATGAITGDIGDWSQSIPIDDSTPCYVIQATAASVNATYSIIPSAWSEVRLFVVDGAPGHGIQSSQVAYAISEDGSTPPETGWSDQIPEVGEGSYLWTRTIFIYEDGATSEPAYSVGSSGIGISSITEEYNLSSSDTSPDGTWSTEPPAYGRGQYIWTRSRILWENGNETTTAPVLNMTWNNIGATLEDCKTDIEVNKTGIQQNTQYYQELYGQLSKINAYIQTGVISVDEQGRTSFGVKIGENLSTIDAYIVSGSTTFSAGWLSDSAGGAAITPMEAVIYVVKTAGSYYNKSYRWTGSSYEEASSEGTLSSIFTSSELGFYDTGEKTAYFSNKNLNVRTVRTNKILLSADVISDTSTNNWQIGIDNGFYLKWIGG